MSEEKQTTKPKQTKVFIEKFKGREIFKTYEVNDEGEKISEFPLNSIGVTKLKDLLIHHNEVLKFVERNS